MVERLEGSAARPGNARNSISSCASRGHCHHVALLLNVTYRFPYRRVTRNEPSSVLKILRRERHTNRGSPIIPCEAVSVRASRADLFQRYTGNILRSVCTQHYGNGQSAIFDTQKYIVMADIFSRRRRSLCFNC